MVWCAQRRSVAAFIFCCIGAGTSADAQELSPQPVTEAVRALPTKVAAHGATLAAPSRLGSAPRRPSALLPLYVSFGTLQLLDTHSTSRAIRDGAVEVNPIMRPFAGTAPAMLAVKAAGTAGVVVVAEKMWKRNKAGAILFMVSANSGMVWVVQNNYRARRTRW